MSAVAVKRPVGRPSDFSPEIAEELIERQSKGEPLARICDDAHMPSFRTVFRWETQSEEFRRLSTRAREIGTHFMAGDCIRIADDPEIDPQNKRIQIDTRLRLIGKWNRKAYGERTELSGPDGGAIEVEARKSLDPRLLDGDQREALRGILAAALEQLSQPEVIEGEYEERE